MTVPELREKLDKLLEDMQAMCPDENVERAMQGVDAALYWLPEDTVTPFNPPAGEIA